MSEPAAVLHDQLPVRWDRAEGAFVSSNGRRYIDFTSGIFVANIGHAHPAVIAAIREQLDHKVLHTYTFPSASRQRLARKLCEVTGYERAFLCSTGAEAVEAALRIARRATGRNAIVSWDDSMHGKTLGAQQLMHGGPDVCRYPFPHTAESFEGPRGQYAAAVMESYQGWSARFYPAAYARDVEAWCQRTGAVLILDEVQAGFGRTGKLFGFQHYGVTPDLVCVGKGLGAGLPLAAVPGSAELLDNDPSLTSTHSGNPICCAAGLASLDVLVNEQLVCRAAALGQSIAARFACFPAPSFGAGMVWALHLTSAEQAEAVVQRCAERGLLLLRTKRHTVKLGPPLTIPEADLINGIDLLYAAVMEFQ